MKSSAFSRRQFVWKVILRTGGLLGAGAVLAHCTDRKKEEKNPDTADATADPCGDLTGVSENDIELRKKFAYVKQSPIADNQCNNCNLYLPPKEGSSCGGCMLFKGPVYPSGYCTYWAPKV